MSRAVGLDIGGTTTRVVEGRLRKGAFEIHRAEAVPTEELAASLVELGLKGAPVVVGVTGRDMILRTTQVPSVPDWKLRELLAFEVEDIAEQSGDELCADFNHLAGAGTYTGEDLVLLALVRSSLVAERGADLAGAKASIRGFTPNAVALHNAVVATQDLPGTTMAVAMRGAHTDIALIEDGELLYARNVSGGGDTFTSAMAAAFRLDGEKAERAKRTRGALAPPGTALEGQQAAIQQALEGAQRQVVGMLQSTVALCRNQLQAPNLEVERVLLCGPGSALGGLASSLSRVLGMPVERFDPTEGYVVGEAPVLAKHGSDFAVATGLAMMAVLPDGYRVEILSESGRAAREFRSKTAWLVLAGVAVLAHLGLYAWASRDGTLAADRDRARASQEVQSRQRDTGAYEDAVASYQELAAKLEHIESVTAPGTGALAVLDLLAAFLPEDLWVTAARTVRAVEPGFGRGGTPRPFVVIEGGGKELDRNLDDAVIQLATQLRDHPAVAHVLTSSSQDSRGRFTFTLRVDTSVVPEGAPDDEVEEA